MITSTFDTKSGKILLEIDVASTISAQILSMGSLSYDFDQTPDSVSIDRVQALYSQVSFSLMQYGDTGEDLWDVLVDEATSADIPCKITLTTWEGQEYEFLMKLRLADISMNERSRNVSIVLIPNVDLGVTFATVFSNIDGGKKVSFKRATSRGNVETSKTYTNIATGVLDWIESALNTVFNNSYQNDVKPSLTGVTDNTYTEKVYDSISSVDDGVLTRTFTLLNLGATEVTPDDSSFQVIDGVGLISSTGFTSNNKEVSVPITINITGGAFDTQVQFGDIISLVNGRGYAEFEIESISSNTLTAQVDRGLEYTDEPWQILRPTAPNNVPAIKVLKDLAGIEGSVFGTGFSKNFYFNRLDRTQANTVTLDYDMVLDFKPKPFYLSLGTSIVAQRADGTRGNFAPNGGQEKFGSLSFADNGTIDTRIPNVIDYTSIALGNANASKELKMELAPAYPFLNKGMAFGGLLDGDYVLGGVDATKDDLLESALTANGLRSYFQALNRTDGGISIEFSIMGATMIFPWQTIQFDTRAPEKYRNRQFRPTSIRYNFVNDTVTVTAYQIDDVETPIFASPYVRAGLNFQVNKTLLPGQMFNAVNDQIASGLRNVATFTLSAPAFGTTSRIFINRRIGDAPIIPANFKILLINPFNIQQQQELTINQEVPLGAPSISVETAQISPAFPAGSYVEITTQSVLTSLIISENAILAQAKSTKIGITTQASSGAVTSLNVVLNTKVREGDDLFLNNPTNGTSRAFTVGQTTGPGEVVLQLDQLTDFGAPAGSEIVGSNAQYEGLLQVTPAGVLAKAVAITTQNAFAILSAPLSVGSVSSIPVTSVRAIKLNAGTAIGVQDTAGNTVFFTIDVTQTLTVSTTSITVTTESISTAIGAGATVVQPMWNQSAQLSIQADQIALRVTETQVQTLIDENIGGLIPAVNFTFQNTDEGFTTSDVTLTTQPTYIEYLATGAGAYIQKSGLSIDSADNPVVTIRVVRIAGTNWNGAFGWSTDGTNFFSQSFAEPSNVDNDFSFATIDLTNNANYTGTITDIRLFLGNANNDEFYIDQISVGKFNPQTQILEDLSTRLSASESAITVEANKIDLFTQKSNELNRIAEVTGTYNQSSTFTSITLTNTRSGFEVRNGQTLFLVNVDGTFQSVTVNGNQTLSTSVTINSEVFVTTIIAGAMLYESSFTSSSRITQQAGTIVLKAEQVSGGTTPISKLALVRLDASVADGSSILLQADQITLDGQTTFLNSLATNRFTQVASNNIVIESGTAPTVRPNASALVVGDVWRDTANNNRPSVWNGSIWGRGFTVINGGTITTGTLRADLVTIQSSASNPNVVIDSTGLTLRQTGTDNDSEVSRSVHWINSGDTTLQSRLISYASSNNIAIDAAGTENAKNFRFSVRRNISATRDFDIGISGNNGAFNNNSLVGDTVIVSQGKILIQGSSATTVIGLVVNSGRVGVGNLATDTSYKFSVTGNSLFTGTITSTGNFSTTGNVTGNDIIANGVVGTARVQTVDARFFSADSSFVNYAQVEYAGTADRTYTIPNVAASDFVMSEGNQTIAGNKTFTGTVTVPSLVLGSAAAKATIAYTTNTARTYTIPNVAASDFVMTQGAQTISGVKTFSSRIEAGGDIRLYDTAAQFINLSGSTTTLTANRTYTFPDANGEFVITAGSQIITGTKTFAHDRLQVRNTGADGVATLRYGTAGANRTYTFSGANGTVWTTGTLQFNDVGGASAINNRSIDLNFGGNVYRINCELLP